MFLVTLRAFDDRISFFITRECFKPFMKTIGTADPNAPRFGI